MGLGLVHHLPRLRGQNKSVPSSLNPSHPKTTTRTFVLRRRATSAAVLMTYAQDTRPYERMPERPSSWGGGLPAGVNPPTASTSTSTCLVHTDRSDGMPTTKVPRPSSPAASPPSEPTGFRSETTEYANTFACGAKPEALRDRLLGWVVAARWATAGRTPRAYAKLRANSAFGSMSSLT